MLKDNQDEAFDLLRTSLTSPHFDSADVERIRSQIISNLRRDTSNPTALAGRKFLETRLWRPSLRPAGPGTLESVPKIDVADLKDYVRRVLAKDTLKIAVVGDVDAATLGQLLDKTFGGLPAKASLTPVADIEAAKPPQRAFIPLDVPQTVMTFGGPGVARHDPNFMAAYVVNHILGGGTLSSRLYHEVREKRGLAYSVYESLLWMDHSALFIGNTGTRADRAGETVDAVDRKSAAWPRTARPSRNWTRPNPISRARRCWRSTPPRNSPPRCCNTSWTSCRSTTSRSATPSSMR